MPQQVMAICCNEEPIGSISMRSEMVYKQCDKRINDCLNKKKKNSTDSYDQSKVSE